MQWCLDHDRRGNLRFAPLQGTTYAALDLEPKPRELDTLVLLDGGALHVRGEAVLRILRHLGGGWSLLGVIGRGVPARDALYRFIARRRHRWFGNRPSCRLPSAGESARFLP